MPASSKITKADDTKHAHDRKATCWMDAAEAARRDSAAKHRNDKVTHPLTEWNSRTAVTAKRTARSRRQNGSDVGSLKLAKITKQSAGLHP